MAIDNVNDIGPYGEPAADRWASALHLFESDSEPGALELWERAQLLFEAKDYIKAAKLLSDVVDEVPELTGPRLLLARAYYHSAQLGRAEEQLRVIVDRDPVEHYAHLMLGRTLERQGRRDEADQWLRLASAFSGDLPDSREPASR